MNTSISKIILNKGKEAAILRCHPWVFSGAVKTKIGAPKDGDTVFVCDHREKIIGTGHFQDSSIMVRVLAFYETTIDENFWTEKLRKAYQLRQQLHLLDNPSTTAFRLVHGEGDGLPGLIIDIYNDLAVLQAHSVGMHRERAAITNALRIVLGEKLAAVYDKSAESLPSQYAQNMTNGFLWGSSAPQTIIENGHRFSVDWEIGQKTGFFLDQRNNRKLLAEYSQGKRVLNSFCYSGGFSVYALKAGARWVDSVDASRKAIGWTEDNVAANEGSDRHATHVTEVLKFLQQTTEPYEVMVLDPPAFAKHLNAKHNAVQGYKRLNTEGMKKIAKGGILFTFSCSQVIDRDLFYNTIVAAALEAGREARVLHHLSQPPDHPVSIFHTEGSYLKGLVLQID